MRWTKLTLSLGSLSALGLVVGAAAATMAACDPDLTVEKRPAATADATDGTTPPPSTETDAASDGAAPSDAGTDAGPTGHKIDGVNDFTAGETFQTSSGATGYESYVSWDAKNLYFGMRGNDFAAGASDRKWVLVYLEGANGTTTGIDYGGQQQPTLPFSAAYHIRIKTDLSYRNGQKWTGAAWVDASQDGLVPDAEKKGDFFEFSITRAALGNPTKIKVHMNMIIEGNGEDWSYAATPKESFVDGKDPNYTRFFEFDLANTDKAPNTYAPLP